MASTVNFLNAAGAAGGKTWPGDVAVSEANKQRHMSSLLGDFDMTQNCITQGILLSAAEEKRLYTPSPRQTKT